MKYILFLVNNESIPFVFSKTLNHDDALEVISRVKIDTSLKNIEDRSPFLMNEPTSAGFIYPDFQPYGHSETLGLDSKNSDLEALLLLKENASIIKLELDNKQFSIIFPNFILTDSMLKYFKVVKVRDDMNNWRRSLKDLTPTLIGNLADFQHGVDY